ncbi:hypothetical protein GCM10009720_11990 [Yaniella flava]|uniref:MobA-like NTP transferase domain-containing protein n=1 Tax=Yaniella flava TaxID=287930 RepID=A0ABP5FVH0_9MICC|nr:NTP transferase domain-containing protein [Micrococcaceae bacterium]
MVDPSQDLELFAMILAGGASSRLHASSPKSTVDKPLLVLDGKRVLTRVIEAATQAVRPEQLVVVGPAALPTGNIATVYEEPPQSGPYMAVRAGLQYFSQQFGPATQHAGVFILGADMPFIGLGMDQLVAHHCDSQTPKAVMAQAGGRLQPLLSYIPRGLADRLFAEPALNAGLMPTLRDTHHHILEVDEMAVADLDTYQDALDAGITF